jgi:hypothetical protein
MVGTDPLHRLRQVGPGGGVGDGVHGQSPGLYRILYVPLVGFQGGASEDRASHPKRPQAGHPARGRQLLVSALCTANAVGRLHYRHFVALLPIVPALPLWGCVNLDIIF